MGKSLPWQNYLMRCAEKRGPQTACRRIYLGVDLFLTQKGGLFTVREGKVKYLKHSNTYKYIQFLGTIRQSELSDLFSPANNTAVYIYIRICNYP